MSYRELAILRGYKTNKNHIVKEFYLPVLKESVLYKRVAGFFSSTALLELSKGVSGLIRNGGKIRFIVSPLLSDEDILAMKRGYDARKIAESALIREFHEPQNDSDRERLNWLASLIAVNRLEIKIALTMPQKAAGLYHEKIGVFYDTEGNRIAFTGSMNETDHAFYNNFESIVVFSSLVAEDQRRVCDIENDFDSLWAGREKNIIVMEFPAALREKLISYKRDTLHLELDKLETEEPYELLAPAPGIPAMPNGVVLHDYQNTAIDRWANQNYRGIFDMATGTGKTFTGLGAVVRLFRDRKKLAVIIVCPYQHLVEQWVEDIKLFNLLPTIGYSSSKQRDWKRRLSNDIMDFRLGVIDVFCFVTTNATYSSSYVQGQLEKLGKNTLLLVDEAHNFGAPNLRKMLNPKFEYRLALSATLDRHGDPEGTESLYEYFGDKCIEYSLDRAIREGKLTPYYYYPKIVYLTGGELDQYREISRKISRQYHKNSTGTLEITELGKKLLIERSRIVAGASNKVALLKELMQNYREDSHILVYCGTAQSSDFLRDTSERDEEGERQIVSVSKMLGLELGMKVTHFTSAESALEREQIKRQFADANPYQVIVAIKCLDEGVNIPSIKTAFILASSTNPKEYIQRRGRVLRLAPSKPYATIYDFITLPTPLDYVDRGGENAKLDLSLIKKEIARMREFGEISKNPSDSDKIIKELIETYGLDTIGGEDMFYGRTEA